MHTQISGAPTPSEPAEGQTNALHTHTKAEKEEGERKGGREGQNHKQTQAHVGFEHMSSKMEFDKDMVAESSEHAYVRGASVRLYMQWCHSLLPSGIRESAKLCYPAPFVLPTLPTPQRC